MTNINCKKCKHYYITWDTTFPNGCKKLNFKTKFMPSIEVYQASGQECLYFESKETNR